MSGLIQRAGRLLRSIGRSRRGSVAVEFALTVPILIGVFAVAVDVGRVVYDSMSVAAAARAGAQYARAKPDDATGVAAAVRMGGGVSEAANVAVTKFCECPSGAPVPCTDSCPDGPRFTFVSVSVSQPYRPMFPYPGIGDEILLEKQAVLRVL